MKKTLILLDGENIEVFRASMFMPEILPGFISLDQRYYELDYQNGQADKQYVFYTEKEKPGFGLAIERTKKESVPLLFVWAKEIAANRLESDHGIFVLEARE